MGATIIVLVLVAALWFGAQHAQSAGSSLTLGKTTFAEQGTFLPWSYSGALTVQGAAGGNTDVAIIPTSASNHDPRLYIFYDDPTQPAQFGAWRNLIIESGGGPGGEGHYILSESTDSATAPALPLRIGFGDFKAGTIRETLNIVPGGPDNTANGVALGQFAKYLNLSGKQLRGPEAVPASTGHGAERYLIPVYTSGGDLLGYLPMYWP